jgi:hypothetical protein
MRGAPAALAGASTLSCDAKLRVRRSSASGGASHQSKSSESQLSFFFLR